MSNQASSNAVELSEDFEGVAQQTIHAGGEIKAGEFTIKFLEGGEAVGITTFADVPGMHEGNVLAVCIGQDKVTPPQVLEISCNRPLSQMSFYITYLHRKAVVRSYNRGGTLLEEKTFLGGLVGGATNHSVVMDTPQNTSISSLTVEAEDWFFIDFLKAKAF